MTDPLNELRKLAEARAKATAGPWFYLYPHDPSYDWGYIRGGEQPLGWTQLPCILRASTSQMSDEELNQHRYNNTDPTADLCTFIALAGSLNLQAILSAWERDRATIERITRPSKDGAMVGLGDAVYEEVWPVESEDGLWVLLEWSLPQQHTVQLGVDGGYDGFREVSRFYSTKEKAMEASQKMCDEWNGGTSNDTTLTKGQQ